MPMRQPQRMLRLKFAHRRPVDGKARPSSKTSQFTNKSIFSPSSLSRPAHGGALSKWIAGDENTIMSNTRTTDNVIPQADIVKRAARLGAEISNVKLSGDLSDEAIRAINQVLLEHKVIFFRDQGHLDDAEQER